MNPEYTVLLYYKYVEISNPQKIYDQQLEICQKLGLKGKILISTEGINGTLEGTKKATEEYILETKKTLEFQDLKFKKSPGSMGKCFKKLQIRIRQEIVSTKFTNGEIGPLNGLTGKYLTSEEFHNWLHDSQKEFYIIDMRNDYETALGRFEGTYLLKNFQNFRDLPKLLPQIEHLKNKTIVTVCTGGVRCETASGLLLKYGFKDVYQLLDGIVTYMEKYPNDGFLGKLYVFDNRVAIGFNTQSKEHKIIGECTHCGKTSENLIDFYENGVRKYEILCEDCMLLPTILLQEKTSINS